MCSANKENLSQGIVCLVGSLHTRDGDHAGYLGQFSPLGVDFAEISDENFAGC